MNAHTTGIYTDQRRLVLVEENVFIATDYAETMSEALPGLHVDTAIDGADAVRFMAKADIIIADFVDGGLATYALAIQKAPGTPFYFLSTIGANPVRADMVRAGLKPLPDGHIIYKSSADLVIAVAQAFGRMPRHPAARRHYAGLAPVTRPSFE